MKRTVPLLLAACMLLAFIAACTPNINDTPPPSPPPGGSTEPSSTDGSGNGGPGNQFVFDESRIRGRTISIMRQSLGERTQMYMDEFSELYGCDFHFSVVPWPQDSAKLIALIVSGDSPDVIDLSDEYLPIYALRGIAEPIDGFFDPESPYIDLAVMEAMRYKGRHYILHPNNRIPVMIFYNKSMFDRYGEDTPMDYYKRGEWTIDKLYEVAEIFNEDINNTGVIDQFGFKGTSPYEFLFANQLPIAEFDPLTTTFRLALGDQRQQEVLQDAFDKVSAGIITPFNWEAAQLFPQGRLAMASYEGYFASTLGAMEDEWSVAPYPVGKYGDASKKFMKPWGAGVAVGAANGYAGMQFIQYSYMRDEGYFDAVWSGERKAALDICVNKDSFFSLHMGIPNFRNAVDQINYSSNSTGSSYLTLFEESRSALEALIADFNAIEEGWVEPKKFVYMGPVDFESGMGYLTLPPGEGVTQEIIDGGIEGKSLRITLEDEDYFLIFGSTVDSIPIAGPITGANAYLITFDYEIIAASGDAQISVEMEPGGMGWAGIPVRQGDKGRAELRSTIYTDLPNIHFALFFEGGTELLIDNFDIMLLDE
jgi:ABC-type glycerol-3-phosphate transport system substrate-binding protein